MHYHNLGREVGVHVTSIFLTEQGHSETLSHQGRRDDSDSPLVAVSTEVPTLDTMCVDQPGILHTNEICCLNQGKSRTGSHTICMHGVVTFAHMEALAQFHAAGFSESVSRFTGAQKSHGGFALLTGYRTRN